VLIEYSDSITTPVPPASVAHINMYIDGGNLLRCATATRIVTTRSTHQERGGEPHSYSRIMSEDSDTSYEINLPTGACPSFIGNVSSRGRTPATRHHFSMREAAFANAGRTRSYM